MANVQAIECRNRAAFVMSFKAKSAKHTSAATSNYPVLQSKTIELGGAGFQAGDEVWPEVSAVLGKTISSDDHVTFEMNGKMAVYEVHGTTLNYSVKLVGIVDDPNKSLPNFPADVPVGQTPYVNWSKAIDVKSVWTCTPTTSKQVAEVCNWAKDQGYKIRPKGIAHGWSPITIPKDLAADAKVVLVDTSQLNQMELIPAGANSYTSVRTGTGATMATLQGFLENAAGGKGAAPGFSFTNTPAPDHLSVGGVLAINGHGTSVPTAPNDDFPMGYGSMSNNILELTAVVTDPNSAQPGDYVLKTFKRGDADMKSFLTHVGKAFIVEVVLHVIDNYNMLCESFMDIPSTTLFAKQTGDTPPDKSLTHFMNQSGRVEAIWFPFTDNPWLKVWTVEAEQPAGSRKVDHANNYPFSDNIPESVTSLAKLVTGGFPSLTPKFGELMYTVTKFGLIASNASKIWGPSKNTLFYVKDTTLRVTANGYAVLMKKEEVQNAVAAFATKFESMLKEHQANDQYPINSPLEIRVTGLDSGDSVPVDCAFSPLISSLSTDEETKANGWDVALWLDVLTLPGTKFSNEFYEELESWFLENFNGSKARVVPEWSKGWAYTQADGAWTNTAFLEHIRNAYMGKRGADDDWNFQVNTMDKYDQHGLYENPLLDTLFVKARDMEMS